MLYSLCFLLYRSPMDKIDVSAARADLARLLEESQTRDVVLQRYGKPAGVLISPERHEELLAAFEELEDVRAFDDAMAEEGENVPWDQVKADLGWT